MQKGLILNILVSLILSLGLLSLKSAAQTVIKVTSLSYNYAVLAVETELSNLNTNDFLGICWNVSGSPTMQDNLVIDTTKTSSFEITINDLPANQLIYFRTVSLIDGQTTYGNILTLETPVSPENLKIGDFYQGGIIAYFYTEKDSNYVEGEFHGFVVSPTDIAISQWGCHGEHTGSRVNRNNLGRDGAYNTKKILAYHKHILSNFTEFPKQCDPRNDGSIAAYICDTLTMGGFEDWVLPSVDEMAHVRFNLHEKDILKFRELPDFYWTSTEEREGFRFLQRGNTNAYATRMNSAVVSLGTPKYQKGYVRAVRYF